jgi:predicted acyl esterase
MRMHNITETYRRLGATSEAQTLVLRLNDCAHRFTKGCKIRLLVAGASFPQYAVNAGRKVDETSVQWKSATHCTLRRRKHFQDTASCSSAGPYMIDPSSSSRVHYGWRLSVDAVSDRTI